MLNYILRRFLIGCVTLLTITFGIYGLIRSMPGTPLTTVIGETDPSRKINPEDLERMTKIFGLDKPWYEAYFVWLGNAVHLDMGRSITQKKPVFDLIAERVWPTLLLSVTSIFLAVQDQLVVLSSMPQVTLPVQGT